VQINDPIANKETISKPTVIHSQQVKSKTPITLTPILVNPLSTGSVNFITRNIANAIPMFLAFLLMGKAGPPSNFIS
jgi:hypothetical protein